MKKIAVIVVWLVMLCPAVWPDTLGYTTIGTWSTQPSLGWQCLEWTAASPSADGTLDCGFLYCKQLSPACSANVYLYTYTVSSWSSCRLVAKSTAKAIKNTFPQWIEWSFSGESLYVESTYVVVFGVRYDGFGDIRVYYDIGKHGDYHLGVLDDLNNPPANLGNQSFKSSQHWNCYATYITAGTSNLLPKRRRRVSLNP